MGMDKNTTKASFAPRVGANGKLLDVAGTLEQVAVEFPGSREKVIGVMERISGNHSHGSARVLKDAAERVAALSMLEILSGK